MPDLYASSSDQEILGLIQLIDKTVDPLLDEDAHDLSLIFQQAAERHLRINPAILVRWIDAVRPQEWSQPGVDAILVTPCCDSADIRTTLRRILTDDERLGREQAVYALAQLHDAESAEPITRLLATMLTGARPASFDIGRLPVALEMIGETSVAPTLQDMIAWADDQAVYWLGRAIHRLTGHSPCAPDTDSTAQRDRFTDQVRHDWAAIDLTTQPVTQVQWTITSSRTAETIVTNGRNVFALTPDDPKSLSWPEWVFTWRHGGERLYETGTDCSTCDVLLNRVGWAPDEAVRLAQAVRDQAAHVEHFDSAFMTALEPLVGTLSSGRYQLRLVDLRLEAVPKSDTWFAANQTDTRDQSDSLDQDDEVYQPTVSIHAPADAHSGKTSSYAPKSAITTGDRDPAFALPFVIAPTQPPSALDPSTIASFRDAILAGKRPAAIVAAHSAQRHPYTSQDPHRSVTGFILDGHHKMAAYTSLGLPYRLVLICDRTPRQPAYVPDPLAIFDELLPRIDASR
ncbi:MAG: hypothetical protein FWF43_02065 [Propionibacteriaceae bacterium]|nr:hypothetical protein [Propionibacteriaceae bacterium]